MAIVTDKSGNTPVDPDLSSSNRRSTISRYGDIARAQDIAEDAAIAAVQAAIDDGTLGGTGGSGALATTPVVIPDAASLVPNFTDENTVFSVTLAGNRVLNLPINTGTGKAKIGWLIVKQDATGGRTLTAGTNVVFLDGTQIDTTANAITLLQLLTMDGGTTVYVKGLGTILGNDKMEVTDASGNPISVNALFAVPLGQLSVPVAGTPVRSPRLGFAYTVVGVHGRVDGTSTPVVNGALHINESGTPIPGLSALAFSNATTAMSAASGTANVVGATDYLKFIPTAPGGVPDDWVLSVICRRNV